MQNLAPTPDEERLATILHALGNPMRLAILRYIAQHPGCICNDLVVRFDRAQATVSQHLSTLRRANILIAEREGHATCYSIEPDNFAWLQHTLSRLTTPGPD